MKNNPDKAVTVIKTKKTMYHMLFWSQLVLAMVALMSMVYDLMSYESGGSIVIPVLKGLAAAVLIFYAAVFMNFAYLRIRLYGDRIEVASLIKSRSLMLSDVTALKITETPRFSIAEFKCAARPPLRFNSSIFESGCVDKLIEFAEPKGIPVER